MENLENYDYYISKFIITYVRMHIFSKLNCNF